MRSVIAVLLASCASIAVGVSPAVARTRHGQAISDSRYAIAFYLPPTWLHPVVSTATSGPVKLSVEDLLSPGTLGVIEVEAAPGREVSATYIAQGVRAAAPGTTITGSSVVRFLVGKAEQLEFTAPGPNNLTIYGDADAFYTHKRTYHVFFYSIEEGVVSTSQRSVLDSWGE